MKYNFATFFTKVPAGLKHVVLLFMIAIISFSPMISVVFELYDVYAEVYEILDEDDSKEKIVFSYDEEMHNKTLCSIQKQLSSYPDFLVFDFKPDVLLPPPKNT